jgi:hypothetical protein
VGAGTRTHARAHVHVHFARFRDRRHMEKEWASFGTCEPPLLRGGAIQRRKSVGWVNSSRRG